MFASPLYAAVIECVPRASAVAFQTAVPAFTAALPSSVAPSENVTVPVSAPPLVVTPAENVTAAPYPEGFALDATVVLVVAIWTVCNRVAEVLEVSLESPP